MTYPRCLREKARRMRRQRLSLDEIVERVALPRTTVFQWIKDIPLQRPRVAYATPARERAWAAQSERHRVKREAAYARGAREYAELALRPARLRLKRKSNSNQLTGRDLGLGPRGARHHRL